MSKKRTTIEFDKIKAEANKVFRESQNGYADGRRAIQSFVDSVLMKAGHYKGFAYLSEDQSVPGNTIGIEFNEANEPKFFDHTRRTCTTTK
jgi:hypothetical protein